MKNQPLLNSNEDFIELADIIQIREQNNEIKQIKKNNDRNMLLNISSKYILKNIFLYIKYNTSLKIIKNNKSIQTKLEININNYKDYSDFEYISKKEEITIKERAFQLNFNYIYFVWLAFLLPFTIYFGFLGLYSIILFGVKLKIIYKYIHLTNICYCVLFIYSFSDTSVNSYGIIRYFKISTFQLKLIIVKIWVHVLYEILILIRVIILLKNDKAIDERDLILCFDFIFLILNFLWVIIKSFHYFFYINNLKIVDKINKYYLIRYKKIYINIYALPNDFINIDKIKYIKNIRKRLEHLNSKEDLDIISSINNFRLNNNLKELKVVTNLPKCIIDEPTEFIICNYYTIFHLSNNNYILKYQLGSFNFDFKSKNKELMNILLKNNINTINIINQGEIQYILLYYDELNNE